MKLKSYFCKEGVIEFKFDISGSFKFALRMVSKIVEMNEENTKEHFSHLKDWKLMKMVFEL